MRIELRTSINMKYIIGVISNTGNGCIAKIWESNDVKQIASFAVDYDFGGTRFAISDCGKYAATATYDNANEDELSIYDSGTGEKIWAEDSLKKIQKIDFLNSQILVVSTENKGIFYLDIITKTIIDNRKGREIFTSNYGDIVLLKSEKIAEYRGKRYKSSTFAYLCALGIKEGVLLSEVNGNLCYYMDGKQIWNTDCLEYGHFVDVFYDGKYIYGITFNVRAEGSDRVNLHILEIESGKITISQPINTMNYCLVNNINSYLIGRDGTKLSFCDGILHETVIKLY